MATLMQRHVAGSGTGVGDSLPDADSAGAGQQDGSGARNALSGIAATGGAPMDFGGAPLYLCQGKDVGASM